MKEEDLYTPLKKYLENQDYTVQGEVHECDMVAVKGEDVVIIELKTRITTTLLIQAARRKEICDSVYIAVPIPPGKSVLPNYKGLKILLKRLEVGLILLRFLKTKTRVEIVLHPVKFEQRMRRKKQQNILREINSRYSEFHKGGIPTSKERITAYKQEALRIAFFLNQSSFEPLSPGELKKKGTNPEKTQQILSRNVYGWFDRIERGKYVLNPAGKEAFSRYQKDYPDLLEKLKLS